MFMIGKHQRRSYLLLRHPCFHIHYKIQFFQSKQIYKWAHMTRLNEGCNTNFSVLPLYHVTTPYLRFTKPFNPVSGKAGWKVVDGIYFSPLKDVLDWIIPCHFSAYECSRAFAFAIAIAIVSPHAPESELLQKCQECSWVIYPQIAELGTLKTSLGNLARFAITAIACVTYGNIKLLPLGFNHVSYTQVNVDTRWGMFWSNMASSALQSLTGTGVIS